MNMMEFTYNKGRVLLDADSIRRVIPAKTQEFDESGMSRQEYWKTRLDRKAHAHTRIIFADAAGVSGQYVDQSFDEVSARLASAAPAAPALSK